MSEFTFIVNEAKTVCNRINNPVVILALLFVIGGNSDDRSNLVFSLLLSLVDWLCYPCGSFVL